MLADNCARTRRELLAVTDKELDKLRGHSPRAQTLRGRDKIALRVGKVIGHYNMAKHFTIEITDEAFTFTATQSTIAAEAALDGIYVLRTSLPADTLPADDVLLH